MLRAIKELIKSVVPVRILHLTRQLRWKYSPQEPEMAFVASGLLGKFCTAVDVGANYGAFCYFLGQVSEKVFAFEANPRIARYLESALPRKFHVKSVALSNEPGLAKLRIPLIGMVANEDMATVSEKNEFSSEDVSGHEEIVVEKMRLDAVLGGAGSPEIGFLKIDVEGHELEVLLGAQDLIRAAKPILLVEVEFRHGSDVGRIFSLLESLEYRPAVLADNGVELVPISVDDVGLFQGLKASSGSSPSCADAVSGFRNNFFFLPLSKSVLSRGVLSVVPGAQTRG